MTLKITMRNKKGTCLGRFVCSDYEHAFSVLSDYVAQYSREAETAYIMIEPLNSPSKNCIDHNLPVHASELQEQAEREGW